MMNDDWTTSDSIDPPPPPFAGRHDLLLRLQQRLIDPNDRHAQLYSGRDSIGKSAWLQHCLASFDAVLLGAYIPLSAGSLRSEHAWLSLLIQNSYSILLRNDFSLSRLPEQPAETALIGDEGTASLRVWLDQVYLPEIWRIIRPQRRLVWLIDDMQHWLDALEAGQLPTDSAAYLHKLMRNHPQLGIVLSIDSDHEERLSHLLPLIQTTDVKRLARLNPDETLDLMRHFAPGISEEGASIVHKSSGGFPRLLQGFGAVLSQQDQASLDTASIKRILPVIYSSNVDELKTIWQHLQRDEKLVLNAISALLYQDPLRPISVEWIENWLVETDYPLDVTAINAALRSLEYHEVITRHGSHIELVMGLMQSWLLENARLEESPHQAAGNSERAYRYGLGLLLVLALLLALALSQSSSNTDETNSARSIPTVTLGP